MEDINDVVRNYGRDFLTEYQLECLLKLKERRPNEAEERTKERQQAAATMLQLHKECQKEESEFKKGMPTHALEVQADK